MPLWGLANLKSTEGVGSLGIQVGVDAILNPKYTWQAMKAGNPSRVSMLHSSGQIPSSENLSLCSYNIQLLGWGPPTLWENDLLKLV